MFNLFSPIKILFFPDICICCGRKLVSSEHTLCVHCIVDAPLTKEWHEKENDTFMKICDRTIIENGCAFFEYRKGNDYSKMIHNMKFRYEKRALYDVGTLMASRLYDELPWLKEIDVIVPVPLHRLRKLRRGYNQAEEISKGVNLKLCKEIDTSSVIRARHRKAQVKTIDSEERWQNADGLFKTVHPEQLEGKHLLIIDDVITTGATIISLINAIKADVHSVKISVLALSSTRKVSKRKVGIR